MNEWREEIPIRCDDVFSSTDSSPVCSRDVRELDEVALSVPEVAPLLTPHHRVLLARALAALRADDERARPDAKVLVSEERRERRAEICLLYTSDAADE